MQRRDPSNSNGLVRVAQCDTRNLAQSQLRQEKSELEQLEALGVAQWRDKNHASARQTLLTAVNLDRDTSQARALLPSLLFFSSRALLSLPLEHNNEQQKQNKKTNKQTARVDAAAWYGVPRAWPAGPGNGVDAKVPRQGAPGLAAEFQRHLLSCSSPQTPARLHPVHRGDFSFLSSPSPSCLTSFPHLS